MKILTQQAHYRATLRGGTVGGLTGLAAGFGAAAFAHRRYPAFRSMTLPFKVFLANKYQDEASRMAAAARQAQSSTAQLRAWARENRYPIITASWAASMAAAFTLVGRNPYLTGPQKLVQARVYAQALTVGLLVAMAALEIGDANSGRGRWETIRVLDPADPEHKQLIEKRVHHERYAGEDLWKDMVSSEEQRMKEREEAAHHGHNHNHNHPKHRGSSSTSATIAATAADTAANEAKNAKK